MTAIRNLSGMDRRAGLRDSEEPLGQKEEAININAIIAIVEMIICLFHACVVGLFAISFFCESSSLAELLNLDTGIDTKGPDFISTTSSEWFGPQHCTQSRLICKESNEEKTAGRFTIVERRAPSDRMSFFSTRVVLAPEVPYGLSAALNPPLLCYYSETQGKSSNVVAGRALKSSNLVLPG